LFWPGDAVDDLCKSVETVLRLFDSERFHGGPHAGAQAMFYAEAKRIKTWLEKNRRQRARAPVS
jgi:hypothetical protein